MKHYKLIIFLSISVIGLGALISSGIILAQQTDLGPASVSIEGGVDVVTFVIKDQDGVCGFFIRSGAGQGLASGGGAKQYCRPSKRVGPFRVSGYPAPFFPLQVEVTDKNNNSYSFSADRDTSGIKYPISELGNCSDREKCKAYCQIPENIKACINFAEKNNLISKEGALKSQIAADVINGPGGCKNKNECEAYCNNVDNISECLEFAERSGLMPLEELEEARKVSRALQAGIQLPGNCKNKNQCEAYCNELSHMDECLNFADKAGFIPPGEIEEARKVAKAMASGVKPPGNCKGKKQCEEFCSNPDNIEECLAFGSKTGLIPPEELEQAKKIIPLMKQGRMPGGCRSKSQCESYCADESHSEECTKFAVEAGFMKPEEAEIFRKTGGKGPGGCQGKQACEDFCNQPKNQQICFDFASRHGLISEEEMRNIKTGVAQFKERIAAAPPEVARCLKEKIGQEVMDKINTGAFLPTAEIGDQMKQCFELQQKMMERQILACAQKPCREFFACLEGFGGQGEPGEETEESPGGQDDLPPEIRSKIDACTQEISEQEMERALQEQPREPFPTGGIPEEFKRTPPPGGVAPSEEEINKLIQEETERKAREAQEQIQQQQVPQGQEIPQGFGPSPEEIEQYKREQIEQYKNQFQPPPGVSPQEPTQTQPSSLIEHKLLGALFRFLLR